MSRIFFLFLIFLLVSPVSAQEIQTAKGIKIGFSGFVKNDFIVDSRRNEESIDGLYTLWPKKPEYDANGNDLNAKSSVRMLSISSRIGARFSGLQIGDTRISAYIEFDFTGGDAANSVRLRHAYTAFEKEKWQILFGRTWHPTFIEKVFPGVMALNTGVPFQVFNRSPQLRITYKLSDCFNLMGAAVYQVNYVSPGPDGSSSRYQRDAMVPNLHLQLQYDNGNFVAGAGFDWKTIQPRTATTGADENQYVTNEKLSSVAAVAYFKYNKEKFEIKGKSMFGQNVAESLLPGGYAVASLDEKTGFETYTPTNHIYSFLNLYYGDKWKAGLFAGYMKNLGTSKNPAGDFYARGADVDECFRISPQVLWQYKNFMFSYEPEITWVSYGTIDRNNKGKVIDTEFVSNFRNLITIFYLF